LGRSRTSKFGVSKRFALLVGQFVLSAQASAQPGSIWLIADTFF